MLTLSARELQRKLGTLTPQDSPIFITKHKKELFVLLSVKEAERLFDISDMDVSTVLEENDIFREYIASRGINTADVLRGYKDNPNPNSKPVKRKKYTLDDIRAKSDKLKERL